MLKVVFVRGEEKVPFWHRGRQRTAVRESTEAVLVQLDNGRVLETARVRRFHKDPPNAKVARRNAAKKVVEKAYGNSRISAEQRGWFYSHYF